ncbi:MAG: ankyrin repeat domain-containing protein [Gammaproteobacteria bacterium]|nr:ankyrin repeat domain-containing protein [Gammaproteobacteria bacterium]MDH3768257.1 ankyrin repeat domain-containing protein [Gammaproteobacteria bacterium]
MLKKFLLMIVVTATLGMLGYTAMAFNLVMKSDAATVLNFAASGQLPISLRNIAKWRVQSWDGCPETNRDENALGLTLRAYGLDGFDNDRVLSTASRLIELGCDIDQHSLIGHTAMHEAILYNEPDVVRFLLAHGADPAVTIETPESELSPSRRYFSGMDSIGFATALQERSPVTNRDEILSLLTSHRSS